MPKVIFGNAKVGYYADVSSGHLWFILSDIGFTLNFVDPEVTARENNLCVYNLANIACSNEISASKSRALS